MYQLIKESTGISITDPKVNLTKDEIRTFLSNNYRLSVSMNSKKGLRESYIEISNAHAEGINLQADVKQLIKLGGQIQAFSEAKHMRMTPLALKSLQHIGLSQPQIQRINGSIIDYDFKRTPIETQPQFDDFDIQRIHTQFIALDDLAEIYLKLRELYLKELDLMMDNLKNKYDMEYYLTQVLFSLHRRIRDFQKLILKINESVDFMSEDEMKTSILSEILITGFNRILSHTQIDSDLIPTFINLVKRADLLVDGFYEGYQIDDFGTYNSCDMYIIKKLIENVDIGAEIERDLQKNNYGLVGHLSLTEKYKIMDL